MVDERTGVVVITWQRREEVLAALSRLVELPERPPVVLVDNGSTDGTAEAVRSRYPSVRVIALSENLGAVGRNIGVRELDTPYVAFCDDDTWWEPGSLTRAADLLDAYPEIAVLCARIVVEPSGVDDPIVAELRESPVPGPDWLPGPAIGSFLAGASVVRRDAFLAHGGFSSRLWLGGEEELLATDLLSGGWELCYREDLVVHHRASKLRDARLRRRVGIRNTLWFTWLRRPTGSATRRTVQLVRRLPRDRVTALALADAVRGVPWVLRERDVVPDDVERGYRLLEEMQLHSKARRYVS
jgi:GT2 family glycosyltransferase